LSKSPAHHNGTEIVPIISYLIQMIPFDVIVYTYEWHPWNHISFFKNVDSQYLEGAQNRTIHIFDEVIYTGPKFHTNQVLWPSHCVEGTDDAVLHKDLYVESASNNVIHLFADNNRIKKTELDEKLWERNVTQVFVAGLATDYCVVATALDAFDLNYITYFMQDVSRGVSLETIKIKLDYLKQRRVKIIQANQVKTLNFSYFGNKL
jgi:nicotinamidase-related amidase